MQLASQKKGEVRNGKKDSRNRMHMRRTFAPRQHLDPHDLHTDAMSRSAAAAAQQKEKKYAYQTKRDPELGLLKVHGMDKDLIWHVLYDDDLELIRDILIQVHTLPC